MSMSDEQLRDEREAQALLYPAVAAFREVLEKVSAMSNIAGVEPKAFDDYVHDSLPRPKSWNEIIDEKRNEDRKR